MILEVVHSTRLRYSMKIAETVMEVRGRPLDGLGQRCLDFELKVDPAVTVRTYRDAFGNHVHYFNHLPAHDHVTVTARSVVETGLPYSDPHGGFPEDFTGFRPPVMDVAGIRRIARRFPLEPGADGAAVGAAMEDLTVHINRTFEYLPLTTTVFTNVTEVLALKSGVCQDFAHLFVAVARSLGVPARYVSGFIGSGAGRVGTGASHAWAEVLVPGVGWVGYDPTNPVEADEQHVRVAVGRDYLDVPPTRGVYTGAAAEALEVTVRTRTLSTAEVLARR